VKRSALKQIGVGWFVSSCTTPPCQFAGAVGGGAGITGNGPPTLDPIADSFAVISRTFRAFGENFNVTLDALERKGAITTLAEPTLIALSGEQASFLAGGEFPVPVLQMNGNSNGLSVVFKEYGVRLNFKPTIIDEDHIRLELEPEVSTIDFSNGVRFNGFIVPALRTRRAKTGVELRDGQSFALAGLLENNETKTLSRIPVVSDIPVIGALFKSKYFEKKETELMFFVTAHMVKPVTPDDLPNMRGMDGLKGNSPLGVEPKGEGVQGQSGYKISGQSESTPAAAPAKVEEPKTKKVETTTQSSSTSGSVSSVRKNNTALPVAKAVKVDMNPEMVRPW